MVVHSGSGRGPAVEIERCIFGSMGAYKRGVLGALFSILAVCFAVR